MSIQELDNHLAVTPDWEEVSRRWSVLKCLNDELFTGYLFSLTDPSLTNYWFRYPVGIYKRPMFSFEKDRGERGGKRHGVGSFGRTNYYTLVVLMPERNADGTPGFADAGLDILNEHLILFFNGRKIPFYDFILGRRVESKDFMLEYMSDERDGEKEDLDRNRLMIRFRCMI